MLYKTMVLELRQMEMYRQANRLPATTLSVDIRSDRTGRARSRNAASRMESVRARALGPSEEVAMSKTLGRFVVADPAVCHGRPTFRGTHVYVSDVLDDVARGMACEAIIERWHGSISRLHPRHAGRLRAPSHSRSRRLEWRRVKIDALHPTFAELRGA
jgi:hypothetical protein